MLKPLTRRVEGDMIDGIVDRWYRSIRISNRTRLAKLLLLEGAGYDPSRYSRLLCHHLPATSQLAQTN